MAKPHPETLLDRIGRTVIGSSPRRSPFMRRSTARAAGACQTRAKETPRRHNLALRLQDYKTETLRFLTDADVPFTNNEAERDGRMGKLRQKISGGFRSPKGAQDFANAQRHHHRQSKQDWNIIETLMTSPDQLIGKIQC